MDDEQTAGRNIEFCHSSERKKRRAPYTLRACDACRRRKCRCDGRLPCRHCASRKISCVFSPIPRADNHEEVAPSAAGAVQPQVETEPPSTTTTTEPATGPSDSLLGINTPPGSCTSSAGNATLAQMVVQLQRQVEQLASQVEISRDLQHSGGDAGDNDIARRGAGDRAGSRGQRETNASTYTEPHFWGGVQPISPPSPRFCGLASPGFSMNQTSDRQNSMFTSPLGQNFPRGDKGTARIIEGDMGTSASLSTTHESLLGIATTNASVRRSRLLLYRSVMTLPETMRLLQLYRDIMDDLHPFVDGDLVMHHASALSSTPAEPSSRHSNAEVSENSLIILNLCLMISLRAETNAQVTEMENRLNASLSDLLNSKLVAPADRVEDVIIVLLMGIYYFYQDNIHTAWRICGMAGRLLMELGFHNSDFLRTKEAPGVGNQQSAVLHASIVVFDRHWGAAIGLSAGFQDLNYGSMPQDLIKTPYLSAMLSFLSTSDKFAEYITSSVKGAGYEVVDAYEVLNLQLEQWRRRFVGAESIGLIRGKIQDQNEASRPPSWALLLALRAEAVRSLLLRPFFFPKANEKASQENIKPAIDLAFDIVSIISALDEKTNLYCVQGPFYHHALLSAVSLFGLMITYADEKGLEIKAAISAQAEAITRIYQTALELSTKYFVSSRASRQLFGKLMGLQSTLDRLEIKSSPMLVNREVTQRNLEDAGSHSAFVNGDNAIPSAIYNGSFNDNMLSYLPEEQRLLWHHLGSEAGPKASDMNMSFDMGCAETLLFDWPLEDQELMFGLNELDGN